MRANILFCLYFFMGVAVQLQAQVTVTGKVIDEQQQPVPYANIVLLSLPDSTFVAGSISNEEGAFSLNVKETKDVLRISSIGYATVYRPLDNRSTDLGIICLASDTQILAEVVVKADMPVTRMRGDALVTNIQNLYYVGNQREVVKIQNEFYDIYQKDDLEKLEDFSKQLDIIAEGYKAQGL